MFITIISIVMGMNIAWYFLSDSWLRHDLVNYPKAKKYTRMALLIWMLLIFIPIISAVLGLGNPLEYGPWIWISILYLWIGGILFWMLGLAAVGIPVWGYSQYKNYRKTLVSRDASKEDAQIGIRAEVKAEIQPHEKRLSRRQLVKLGLVATPPLIVGGVSIATVLGKNRLDVRKIDLPVRNLPPDLEGYTITHLSDTHIGMVTGRERIENIVLTANELKSNMTVVTGDILDNNFDYMSDLVETIGELKAEQGVYLCIGNHDKIHSGNEWVNAVRDAGLNLLLDEAAIIDTGSSPIKLLGIDYSNNSSQDLRNIQRADEHSRTPDNSLKLLLAHHPHAFDAAVHANIPVTLAGHTHGGQIALRIGENIELFNAGEYLFRYNDGIYRKEDGSSLFVHRGSGDWFPLRVGVPTDVVQLRLVPQV